MEPCTCSDEPQVTCPYHGDTSRLAGGKVLPWPQDWPIPEWDRGEHTYGDYVHPITRAIESTQGPDGQLLD